MWNLEGLKVSGMYMREIPVSGKCVLSRVKYGGGVTHHIELDEPITVYGSVRDSVILEHLEVTQVASHV